MKKQLVVFRCGECADDLKEYNPYIFEDGTPIPLEDIEVIVVPGNYCENAEENMMQKPQLQTPVWLKDASEKPWSVSVWETDDDREQGNKIWWDCFDSFTEAYTEAEKAFKDNGWAAMEISIDFPDESIPVYIMASTEPMANEFIKHKEDEE